VEDAMNEIISGPGPSEEEIFFFDVSDDALERVASANEIAANLTVPSAIICVPFEG
jgi:hypothetical protein